MTDNVLRCAFRRKRVVSDLPGEIRLLTLLTAPTCTTPRSIPEYVIRRRAASAVLAQRSRWAQLATLEAVPVQEPSSDRAFSADQDADPDTRTPQLPPDRTLDAVYVWAGYAALFGTAYLVLRLATSIICR